MSNDDQRWASTTEGMHLRGRRKVNTGPELLLRKALHAMGGRFRLHRQLAKGCTPDLVMPSRRLAVFVDGCFWHGCPEHGRKEPWSGPNAALWEAKMIRNAERDQRSTALAEQAGWRVSRLWECQIRRSLEEVASSLMGVESATSESRLICVALDSYQPPTQLNREPDCPPR